jgi:hypothetical protein
MYYLSELSQAVIRHYAEHHRWSIQTWPGRFRLPAALFAPMTTAAESQEVSKRTFLPEGVDKKLGALVRTSKNLGPGAATSSAPGTRKRKSDVNRDSSPPASIKKPRAEKPEKVKRTKKVAKVKAKKAAEVKAPVKEGDRRRSGRVSLAKQITYVEEKGSDEYDEDDDSEDEEMGDASESEEEPAPAPTPKPRGRPARNSIAASAKKPTPKKAAVDVVEMEIDTPEPEKEAEEEEEAESSATPPPAKSPVKQLPVGRRSARSNAAAKSKTPEKATAKAAAKPAVTRRSGRGRKAAERADSSDLSDVPDDE